MTIMQPTRAEKARMNQVVEIAKRELAVFKDGLKTSLLRHYGEVVQLEFETPMPVRGFTAEAQTQIFCVAAAIVLAIRNPDMQTPDLAPADKHYFKMLSDFELPEDGPTIVRVIVTCRRDNATQVTLSAEAFSSRSDFDSRMWRSTLLAINLKR
jgi:hypothetical protein